MMRPDIAQYVSPTVAGVKSPPTRSLRPSSLHLQVGTPCYIGRGMTQIYLSG